MTKHKLTFMAKPSPEVLKAIRHALAAAGLGRQLGGLLFPEDNWHQSLTHLILCDDSERDRIIKAVSQIDTAAFTMVLNSVSGPANDSKSIHWAVRPTGKPSGFDPVLASIRAAIGFKDMGWNSPHITICYDAPSILATTQIQPIPWRISELLLVEIGEGLQDRYQTLARCSLRTGPAGLESQPALW